MCLRFLVFIILVFLSRQTEPGEALGAENDTLGWSRSALLNEGALDVILVLAVGASYEARIEGEGKVGSGRR